MRLIKCKLGYIVLDKQQGIRVPSQTVCTELHNMGIGATILLSPDQVHILSNGPIVLPR